MQFSRRPVNAGGRSHGLPENQLPVSLPVDLLLGRTDNLAVVLTGMTAYRDGVEFTIRALRRGGSANPSNLVGALTGHRHPRSPEPNEQFLLGFEFADGRTVTNVGGWPPREPVRDEDISLDHGSGGGSDRSAHANYHLSPLPPAGPFSVIAAWPACGIAETRHDLDAAAIRAAAERAVILWPDQPDPDPPRRLPPPELPAGGWFERANR